MMTRKFDAIFLTCRPRRPVRRHREELRHLRPAAGARCRIDTGVRDRRRKRRVAGAVRLAVSRHRARPSLGRSVDRSVGRSVTRRLVGRSVGLRDALRVLRSRCNHREHRSPRTSNNNTTCHPSLGRSVPVGPPPVVPIHLPTVSSSVPDSLVHRPSTGQHAPVRPAVETGDY